EPNEEDKSKKAPAAFKYRINTIYIKRSSPGPNRYPPDLDLMMRNMNKIDLNILNTDPSRIIRELEYEIYTTDKQSGVEVGRVRRVDRTKIKPGEEKKRRSLSWNPDSILKNCNPLTKCTIDLRIVRVKFDDGSEWQGQIEAEKSEKASKNEQ
ncbi:MAG TPA: hypothetical protein VID27_10805, partial [Blastocatellia bacterium]